MPFADQKDRPVMPVVEWSMGIIEDEDTGRGPAVTMLLHGLAKAGRYTLPRRWTCSPSRALWSRR
jgi:hypothetical protein